MSSEITEVPAQPTPGVQIDLRNNPSTVFFKDWSEINTFLSEDLTAWNPFFTAYQQLIGRFGGTIQGATGPHQSALQLMINQAIQSTKGNPLDTSMKNAVEAILQPYISGISIHSKSSLGLFILGSSAPFPSEKFTAYMAAVTLSIRPRVDPFVVQVGNGILPGTDYITGMVAFKLFDAGLYKNGLIEKERSQYINDELAKNLASAQSLKAGFEADLVVARTSLSEIMQSISNERQNISNDHDQFQSNIKSQFDELRSEHEKAMEAIRLAFKDEIKLRAARNYWDQVSKENRKFARMFWWVFVGSLPAAILAISLAVDALIKFTGLTLDKSEWFIVGLPTVLVLWVVRSIHRQWSTYHGLANDARERVTMVETYLALVSEGKMTELERPMVLQPLFRPSSVAGDDGMYKGVIDHLIDTMNQAKGGH